MTRKLFLRLICLSSMLLLLVFSHPNGARANYACEGPTPDHAECCFYQYMDCMAGGGRFCDLQYDECMAETPSEP
jgi:hypothetical protein